MKQPPAATPLLNIASARPKAPHGTPCNHCGRCCIAALCDIGKLIFGTDRRGPCPALMWDDAGSRCGLMSEPERFASAKARLKGTSRLRAAAKFLIGSGLGCDYAAHGEPVDVAFRDGVKTRLTRAQRIAALETWGLVKALRAAARQ
jgi:hypothetical protein